MSGYQTMIRVTCATERPAAVYAWKRIAPPERAEAPTLWPTAMAQNAGETIARQPRVLPT